MTKQSAGIIPFRRNGDKVEILLTHMGGPYWRNKDDGAWSMSKGELDQGEDHEIAARREFLEELGFPVPNGEWIDLGEAKVSDGKNVHAWAIECDFDANLVKSNMFTMEWPPKSGQEQEFPEVDRGAWFTLKDAPAKILKGQRIFLERIAQKLGVNMV